MDSLYHRTDRRCGQWVSPGRPRPGEVPEAGAVFTDWLEQILPTSSQVTAAWGCCSGYAQFRTQQGVSHQAGAAQPAGHGLGGGPSVSCGADSVRSRCECQPQRGREEGSTSLEQRSTCTRRLVFSCCSDLLSRLYYRAHIRDNETEARGAYTGLGFRAPVLHSPGVALPLQVT